MKNVVNRALVAKKKLMILAIGAILATGMSAQEVEKKEFAGKKLSKAERVEIEVKRLSHELFMSDEQAAKFAVTYREYAEELDKVFEKKAPKKKHEQGNELTDKDLDAMAKQRFERMKELADLQLKYYDKFRKDLSARQVEKVLQIPEPFGGKHCCGKHGGHKGEKKMKRR